MASPSVKGATYERTSFMRGRMYGSTEKNVLRMSTWPSAGSGIGVSATSNSSSSGNPRGRATRRISRETPSMQR
jgi:hypothetical protein